MLIGRLKTESVLEIVHHMFDIGLGAPCKYLIVSLRFFGTLKIFPQGVLWIRHLLESETLSSDGVKHTIRVPMYRNKAITVEGHIRIVFSFIAHPDVTYSHGRDNTKGCQGI